jgi:hypothetical protein
MVSCTSCGADWSEGDFSPKCAQCGGGALDVLCLVCGGKCGARWQRAIIDSQDEDLANWFGTCALPKQEQRDLLSRRLK